MPNKAICAAFLISACVIASPQSVAKNDFEGVWEVTKIVQDYDSPYDSKVNADPLPSVMIFTASHYSFVWLPGEIAINAFETRWEPTDQEKLQQFGELVINTGSYEIRKQKLQVTPIVARMSEFMGGLMVYGFKCSGKDLILTLLEEYTFDGVPAPWVDESSGKIYLTLSRITD